MFMLAEATSHNFIPDFSLGAARILEFLAQRVGFNTWALGKVVGSQWIVLEVGGKGRRVSPGDSIPWPQTLCFHALSARVPNIIPDIAQIPALHAVPLAQKLGVRAYISIPIYALDGTLFGTLCAFDESPAPGNIVDELPLLELLAELLKTLLDLDNQLSQQIRDADKIEAETLRDQLTNLHNRRGWEVLVSAEIQRGLRHSKELTVLSVDLDGLKRVNDTQGHEAGDALICKAAETLRATMRPEDVIARMGGDEFQCLLVNLPRDRIPDFIRRLENAAADRGVSLSVGAAVLMPNGTLEAAVKEADQAMYSVKRTRPSHRAPILA
jgi:diguanylate cyclase (GGDEF)-like protein